MLRQRLARELLGLLVAAGAVYLLVQAVEYRSGWYVLAGVGAIVVAVSLLVSDDPPSEDVPSEAIGPPNQVEVERAVQEARRTIGRYGSGVYHPTPPLVHTVPCPRCSAPLAAQSRRGTDGVYFYRACGTCGYEPVPSDDGPRAS